MSKLNGIKVFTVGTVALLSVLTVSVGSALAQDNQKPAAQTQQKTEQTSGCSCCKKMMSDTTNTMPGMNHSTSPTK